MISKFVPSLILHIVPLVLLTLASACKPRPEAIYRASLRYIPTSADPYTSEIDTDNFIMIQLSLSAISES